MWVKFISPVLLLVQFSYCANILAIIPTPSYSHQIAWVQLWKKLSLKGHSVTVITTNPLRDSTLTNLTEIDMSSSYVYFKDISRNAEREMDMWNFYPLIEVMFSDLSLQQLSHPAVQDLIGNKSKRFDVVLVEFLFPEYLAFAEIYNCPSILVNSLHGCEVFHKLTGNPSHPYLNPHFITPFQPPLSFKERVLSTIHSWDLYHYHVNELFPQKDEVVRKYFNISTPVEEMVKNVDLTLLNKNPVIHGVRAVGPTSIDVGGQREVVSTKALPGVSFCLIIFKMLCWYSNIRNQKITVTTS